MAETDENEVKEALAAIVPGIELDAYNAGCRVADRQWRERIEKEARSLDQIAARQRERELGLSAVQSDARAAALRSLLDSPDTPDGPGDDTQEVSKDHSVPDLSESGRLIPVPDRCPQCGSTEPSVLLADCGSDVQGDPHEWHTPAPVPDPGHEGNRRCDCGHLESEHEFMQGNPPGTELMCNECSCIDFQPVAPVVPDPGHQGETPGFKVTRVDPAGVEFDVTCPLPRMEALRNRDVFRERASGNRVLYMVRDEEGQEIEWAEDDPASDLDAAPGWGDDDVFGLVMVTETALDALGEGDKPDTAALRDALKPFQLSSQRTPVVPVVDGDRRERVARAIYEAEHVAVSIADWGTLDTDKVIRYRRLARAALAAAGTPGGDETSDEGADTRKGSDTQGEAVCPAAATPQEDATPSSVDSPAGSPEGGGGRVAHPEKIRRWKLESWRCVEWKEDRYDMVERPDGDYVFYTDHVACMEAVEAALSAPAVTSEPSGGDPGTEEDEDAEELPWGFSVTHRQGQVTLDLKGLARDLAIDGVGINLLPVWAREIGQALCRASLDASPVSIPNGTEGGEARQLIAEVILWRACEERWRTAKTSDKEYCLAAAEQALAGLGYPATPPVGNLHARIEEASDWIKGSFIDLRAAFEDVIDSPHCCDGNSGPPTFCGCRGETYGDLFDSFEWSLQSKLRALDDESGGGELVTVNRAALATLTEFVGNGGDFDTPAKVLTAYTSISSALSDGNGEGSDEGRSAPGVTTNIEPADGQGKEDEN